MTLAPVAAAQHSSAPATAREFLSFKLGAEEYGIDILRVQEIRGFEAPTRMANAPAFVKGVVNLRGVIVPIVDMRLRFGLADVQCNAFTVIIRPTPEFNGAMDAGYVTGLGSLKTAEGTAHAHPAGHRRADAEPADGPGRADTLKR